MDDMGSGGARFEQKSKGGAAKILALVAIALAALTVCACVIYITIYLRNYFSAERAAAPPTFQRDLRTGDPAEKGEMVFLNDGSMGEIWIPALEGVLKNEYDLSAFSYNDGIIIYDKEGAVSAVGIDVSSYQGDIDWQRVKDFGIEFAMIRVGFRGYVYDNIKTDECFEKNIKGALGAGIKVGVYFFSQAISEEEAAEEAAFVIGAIKDYKIDYPVVFDWEVIAHSDARTDDVSVRTLSDCAVAFCDAVERHGYTPMVYANKRLAIFKYDLSKLKNYDFWVADYNLVPTFFYKFEMWQYSEKGVVDGIEGFVDLNLCFVDYAAR